MGCYDRYCAFCANPLEDTYHGWLNWLSAPGEPYPPKDGEWNPKGFPTPTKPKDEIVTISEHDGRSWDDVVCVSPSFKNNDWVSTCEVIPSCVPVIYIDGEDWERNNTEYFIVLHRSCLSIFCRLGDITPQAMWESFYAPTSDYQRYSGRGVNGAGMFYCVEYYDMEGRFGQGVGYAVEMSTPSKHNPPNNDLWVDYDTMEDTKWLLARPTALPRLTQLMGNQYTLSNREGESRTARDSVLATPELLGLILLEIILPQSQEELVKEMFAAPASVFIPPSVTAATRTIFDLMLVDRFFNLAVVGNQHIFLRLAWQHGWMLPASPLDWEEWANGDISYTGREFCCQPGQDWRKYLLTFLRKEGVHVKNRWRFHRMCIQFARGKTAVLSHDNLPWKWRAGQLGVLTSLRRPAAWKWEIVRPSIEL